MRTARRVPLEEIAFRPGPVVGGPAPPSPVHRDVAWACLAPALLHELDEVLDVPYLAALDLSVQLPVEVLGISFLSRATFSLHLSALTLIIQASFLGLPRAVRAPLNEPCLRDLPLACLTLCPTPRDPLNRGHLDPSHAGEAPYRAPRDRVLYEVLRLRVEDYPVLADAERVGR